MPSLERVLHFDAGDYLAKKSEAVVASAGAVAVAGGVFAQSAAASQVGATDLTAGPTHEKKFL